MTKETKAYLYAQQLLIVNLDSCIYIWYELQGLDGEIGQPGPVGARGDPVWNRDNNDDVMMMSSHFSRVLLEIEVQLEPQVLMEHL